MAPTYQLEGLGKDEWTYDHSLKAGFYFFPVFSMELAGLDDIPALKPFLHLSLIILCEDQSSGL
jgi:hypothetical protein